MTALGETAPERDPLCERHGCKHPLSDHVPAAGNVAHPCRVCGCPSFSGWATQQGRASAGGP